MKKLPLGIQTFEKLIKNDCLYLDKTEHIFNLLETGSVYFLSRPRRFGKSLLVSTLKAIFMGQKELFHGLFIYDKITWETHPVLHIDFSMMTHDTPENLEKSIHFFLDKEAKKAGLEYTSGLMGEKCKELIEHLAKEAQVVILVDEYDKAIIGSLPDINKAGANRQVLRNFFDPLKGLDPFLKFVFLTGVTKFSKVSIFSGLDNLEDLTIDPRSATLLGITEDEVGNSLAPWLEKLAETEKLEPRALREKIRLWYNGYSFDGINRVYNPTSLFNLCSKNRFSNYWFATGTPTFLLEVIKKNHYHITELEETRVDELVMESHDINKIDPNALLLQTGYLTIKDIKQKRGEYSYTLCSPNKEVKDSFLKYLAADFTGEQASKITPLLNDLLDDLEDENLEAFIIKLRAIFARIPAHLYLDHEYYYHSLFYMILALMGCTIELETLTDKGRIDAVLEFEKLIYVIELKTGPPGPGMEQIKKKGYHESYMDKGKKILLLAVGGFKKKEIGYLVEPV